VFAVAGARWARLGGPDLLKSVRTWYLVVGATGLAAGLAVAGLAMSALAGAPVAEPGVRRAAPDVVVSSTAMPDGEVVITVLDAASQRLVVYAADSKRSRLKLLAVRDISADMLLTDYNNDKPLPREIRAILEGKGAEAPKPAPAPDGRPPAAVP
jgi:hypothetical protein